MHDRGVVTSEGVAVDLPYDGKCDRSRRRERSNSDQATAAATWHHGNAL